MTIPSARTALGLVLVAALLSGAAAEEREEREDNEGQEEGEREKDDPGARLRALREWRADTAESGWRTLIEARRERDRVGDANLGGDRIPSPWGSRGSQLVGSSSAWINLGPTNAEYNWNGDIYDAVDSGRIRQILVHPANADVLTISTAGGGIWKTYDAGDTWQPIGDRLGTLSIGALAMDPQNPDLLYVGFGDPFDIPIPGLARSLDGGATWLDPVLLSGTYGSGGAVTASSIRKIQVDPAQSNHVLAATNAGLFKTSDGGATWTVVPLPHPSGDSVQASCRMGETVSRSITAPSGNLILCGAWDVAWTGPQTWVVTGRVLDLTAANGNSAVDYTFNLWRSTDDGATWQNLTTAFGDVAGDMGRSTLAVAASTTANAATSRVFLLAGKASDDDQKDLFRSEDGGKTWQALGVNSARKPLNPTDYSPDLNVIVGQAWYNQAITVDSLNADLVYIGGTYGAVRSRDGGATWDVISDWLPTVTKTNLPYVHADMHAMAVGPGGVLYIGSDGGVFRSDNAKTAQTNAVTFTHATNRGLATHQIYGVACASDSFPAEAQGYVIGGMQDNGVRARLHSGGVWTSAFDVVLGGDGITAAVSGDVAPGTVYPQTVLATQQNRIRRAVGAGPLRNPPGVSVANNVLQTFHEGLSGGLPFHVRVRRDVAAAAPDTFLTYTTSPNGVYRVTSAASGGTWANISGQLHWPDGVVVSGFVDQSGAALSALRYLTTHPTVPNVYAVATNRIVYVTTNGGGDWFATPAIRIHEANGKGYGPFSLGAIAFDPSDATGNTFYLSTLASRLIEVDVPAGGTSTHVALPESVGILKLVRFRRFPEANAADQPVVPEVGLQAIFRMLRAEYGIDFSQYKPSTVTRRVERRLLLNQSLDVEQYVDRLSENIGELNQLYKDLMIGVTQFFRDREAFHRLAVEELPRLLAGIKDDQEFRVWVAGCATGEEAYSLAIIIHEQLALLHRQPTVRIFATDAHRASLDFASAGVYSAESLNSVSPQRREQYFVQKGDGFQVVAQLRKMIVFAPHDLLKDAPFTRLDLISCRNLLIYLQPGAQKKVLSLFHFGLKAGGVLFLGPSESPGDLSDEFEPADDHWKLYRKRRDVRLRPDFRLLLPSGLPQKPRINSAYTTSAAASDRLQQAVYDRLLEEHMPPSFLINDRKELVHCFGGAGKYLQVRNGRATTQFLELVDAELKIILLGALARAEKQMLPVVFTGIRVPSESGGEALMRLTVKPLNDRISGSTSHLVILEDMGQSAPPRDDTEIDLGVASREQVVTLEQELSHTRENLQAMIEEQESSNEELQATNEELVASNEELQSTNEELHSVNEELYTVNAEYQHKIEELTQVTADLENLLLATDVGILFLDHSLCIRRFTPRVGKLFNLLPQDIGRPITGFTNLLDEPLIDALQQVLNSGMPIEKEIHDSDGNSYFLRILSYQISPAALDGVVLSLIDISPLKKAEARLQHLSAIVECSADAIVGKDLDGTILSWNRGAEAMYGYQADEVVGRNTRMLYAPGSTDQFDAVLKSIRAGEAFTGEHQRQRKDGAIIDVQHTVSPIWDRHGRVIGASGISRDITARKQAEREIQQAIRNRDQFLAMLSHELRNPLGAILNASHILEVANLSREAGAACRVVNRQAEQMRLLLDDLLDVARVTQNKIVLRREDCLMADVIAAAREAVQPIIASREQQLEVTGLDSEIRVHGDPSRLQQVVINLLKNAAKYSPPRATISVRLGAEDGQAILQVKDFGVGISAEMLNRVFDLFVQSNETLDRADGGMGVGLTLVKAIIELHGGTVVARSDGYNTGSEFTVRLPLQPAGSRPHDVGVTDDSGGEPTRRLRIAIVEDNADSRATLQALLQLDQHEVEVAADGLAGIKLISEWHPDVALVDIGLPGLDGFEVARRVRADRRLPAPYLVALTGYGFPADREKALAAGFDKHLIKPLRRTQFKELFQSISTRKQ